MNKSLVSFLIIFGLLFLVVGVKYYFFLHPNRYLFLLSNSDIMFKAAEFLKKPTPRPYLQSYIEYPVLLGVWATSLAYFSWGARDYFLLNGFFLSFFSALNVLLAVELARKILNRKVSPFVFLTPSVIFFTFFNWDSFALFFLLAALYLFSIKKLYLSVLLVSLGAWVKIFPTLALFPILYSLFREKKYLPAAKSLALFAFVSLALNLPFALSFFDGWVVFFSFSTHRPPNVDSVWNGLYLASDKIFGRGFYWKRYYGFIVNNASLALTLFAFLYLYLIKIRRKLPSMFLAETTFLLSVFLFFSKVYSPQYNLWVVFLFMILGLNWRKILMYEGFNLLLAWVVFQYFWQVFMAGKNQLDLPYFKIFYLFSLLRHWALFLLIKEAGQKALGERS